MKIKLYILSIFVLLGISCSKEITQQESGIPIDFNTNIEEATKVGDYFLSGEKLGLFGYNLNEGESWNGSGTPDFMYNEVLEYTGTIWHTLNIYYWSQNPALRKRFYAYYPYNDGSNGNLVLSPSTYAGSPYVDININDGKTDFIVCAAQEGNVENPVIQFTAKHALAKLSIGFATDLGEGMAYARATKVSGVIKSGRYTYDAASGNGFENSGETIDIELPQPQDGDLFINSNEAVYLDEYTLYLLPPNNDDGLGGVGIIETVINGIVKEFDLSSVPLRNGKGTNIKIIINQKETTFTATIGDWESGGSVEGVID